MTYGVEFRLVPTATHVVSLGHAIELTCVPDGMDVGKNQWVRSTVLTEVAPPPWPMPAATQVVVFAHDTEVSDKTEGCTSVAQSFPSDVPTIAGDESTTPTATQLLESTHETPSRESSPAGATC